VSAKRYSFRVEPLRIADHTEHRPGFALRYLYFQKIKGKWEACLKPAKVSLSCLRILLTAVTRFIYLNKRTLELTWLIEQLQKEKEVVRHYTDGLFLLQTIKIYNR